MALFKFFAIGVNRRLLLLLLGLLVYASNFITSAPVSSCPNDCECSTDQFGYHIATCTDIHLNSNAVAYSKVNILILRPTDTRVGCKIPKDVPIIFPRLNSLKLTNCLLTYIPKDLISGLNSIQEIDLSSNFINNLSDLLFAVNKHLRYVNLENNPLVSRSICSLRSKSIEKLNLARCNLTHLDVNAFEGLPNLRYLSLADNSLQFIDKGTLPKTLKSVNLSGNEIENVPLIELNRLNRLNEIDLSRNPVNCSCELMGFQNWKSGKGTIFRNHIECALPLEYSGKFLSSVPQYDMCDAKVQQTDEQDSNKILLNDDLYREEILRVKNEDDFIFDVQINSVVDQEDNNRDTRRRNLRSNEPFGLGKIDLHEGSGDTLEGSGDEDEEKKMDEVNNHSQNKVESNSTSLFEFTTPAKSENIETKEETESSSPALISTELLQVTEESTDQSLETSSKSSTKLATIKDENIESESEAETSSYSSILAHAQTSEQTVDQLMDSSSIPSTEFATKKDKNVESESEVETSSYSSSTLAHAQTSEQSVDQSTDISSRPSSEFATVKDENIESKSEAEISSYSSSTLTHEQTSEQSVDQSTGSYSDQERKSSSQTNIDLAVTNNEDNEPKTEVGTDTTISEQSPTLEILISATSILIESSTSKPVISSESPTQQSGPLHFDLTHKLSFETTTIVKEQTSNLGQRDTPTSDSDPNKFSTNEAMQSHITKSENNKNAGGEQYIIPTLLIIAVVLICFSIYMSQNNCYLRRWKENGGSGDDHIDHNTKLNNTTEMQDVNLLTADSKSEQQQRYSKKYHNSEGENAQTEKLMNGVDDEYSDENANPQPSTNDDVPDSIKSTTRVTK